MRGFSLLHLHGLTHDRTHTFQPLKEVFARSFVKRVLSGGRVFVRFKNKTVANVKGMVKAPKAKKLSVEEMNGCCGLAKANRTLGAKPLI